MYVGFAAFGVLYGVVLGNVENAWVVYGKTAWWVHESVPRDESFCADTP